MTNAGAPYDPTTPVGQVRALIDDDAPDEGGNYRLFGDNTIKAYLAMGADSPLRAAAFAVETVAMSQVLLLKSFSADDLSVRGDLISDSLRKLALQWRTQADTEDRREDYDAFELVPLYEGDKPELADWPRF
uniref:Uncharacterized protein n=1 Tax=Clavibacter phage CN77 TaxID=686440 RepID=E9LS30_9VIRU|nr:unknown [Clavibacter phage CN77]